jgi:hypothetical protein
VSKRRVRIDRGTLALQDRLPHSKSHGDESRTISSTAGTRRARYAPEGHASASTRHAGGYRPAWCERDGSQGRRQLDGQQKQIQSRGQEGRRDARGFELRQAVAQVDEAQHRKSQAGEQSTAAHHPRRPFARSPRHSTIVILTMPALDGVVSSEDATNYRREPRTIVRSIGPVATAHANLRPRSEAASIDLHRHRNCKDNREHQVMLSSPPGHLCTWKTAMSDLGPARKGAKSAKPRVLDSFAAVRRVRRSPTHAPVPGRPRDSLQQPGRGS